MLELLITAVLLFASFCVFSRRRDENFPAGPLSLPVVGNFIQVGMEPHKSVMAMRKKYGDIIGIDLGPKRAVFINESGLIKEAFSLLSLCWRPRLLHYTIKGNTRGIALASGKAWMEQRKFAFSYIQSGFRNGVPIENLITQEANELIEHLKGMCGRPMSTRDVFNIPVLNILWGIVAGERYSMTDPKFLKIVNHSNLNMSNPALLGIFVFFFKWAKMFPNLLGYKHYLDNLNPVLDFIQDIINRHKETYQDGIKRDLIDCYLEKMANTTDEQSSFYGITGEENLLLGLHDIFLGGSDTSANTLKWIVLFMAHNPEMQEKLHTIISKHMVNRSQSLESLLKDREKLPFVEAVIMEALRFASILPVGVMHEASEDVKFKGYVLPKGTMVISNIYGVHHDPEIWGDPEKFRPERFLNEDETEIVRHPSFIAFSAGRRICPGESLGRDELFIFTMKLFQSFKVEFNANEPIPKIKHSVATIVSPVDYKVIFSQRSN